jgi:hypothetical protein
LRLIALIVATILLFWIMVTAAARVAVNEAIKAPWPDGLGVIRDVPRRYPVRKTTEETKLLAQLAVAVDVQLGGRGEEVKTELMSRELQKQLLDYLLAQMQKPDDAVDEPPPELAAFLAERRAAIVSLTSFINDAAPRIGWSEDVGAESPPSPNLTGYANLTRVLAADALLKGRAGDATAWERIRAIEALAKPMWRRGDTWSVSIALSASRLANGAARKLPPPLPPWWRDVDAFDARRAVIAGQQAKSWMWWNWVETRWKTKPVLTVIFSPYIDASMSNFLNSGRSSAEEFAKLRDCGVDADAFAHRSRPASWSALRSFGPGSNGIDEQRARVYDFERDATARVFALKEHRPLPTASRCADGTWSHANGELRFSAPIPLKPPGKPAVPRTLRY